MRKTQSAWLFVGTVVLVFGIVGSATAQIVQWKTEDGGNGHWYQAIAGAGGITWTDANSAAEAMGGGWHLATITSPEENAFVYSLVSGDPRFWFCCLSGNSSGPWLGGAWVGPGVGDYEWVTGEPFVYTNWGPREPFGNGRRIALFGYQASEGPFWNDIGPDRLDVVSYVVETSVPPDELIMYPFLALGGGFEVILFVTNQGQGNWTGALRLNGGDWPTDRTWALDGNDRTGESSFEITLSPNQTQKFVLSSSSIDAFSGWLELRGDDIPSLSNLATSFFYNFITDNELIDSTGVAPAEAVRAVRFPVERTSSLNTGVAIRLAESRLTFSLYDAGGNFVRGVIQTFDGAKFFNEIFADDTEEFVGSVKVESDGDFYLTVLRQELVPAEELRFQLTSIPATPVP